MDKLYEDVCLKCSKLTTNMYSTSFSLGIKMLGKRFHDPIYAIYGFVRFADEIVDTFHEHDKLKLLKRFKEDTYQAIEEKISLNPILYSFQKVVNDYQIPHELIDSFLYSMELDLNEKKYDQEGYEKYIYGSAEVVGLMCLKVFCEGDQEKYTKLSYYAKKLGSAFQKINFLRDMQADYKVMGRMYFPNIDITNFDENTKLEIEKDIAIDFKEGYEGIKLLPKDTRFGVYVAYIYYSALLKKIKQTPCGQILNARIRVSDSQKISLLFSSYIKHQLNII
jgi:15-cis-phytoene synthase